MATNVPQVTPEEPANTPDLKEAPLPPSDLGGALGTTSMKDALSFARPIVNEMQQPITDSLQRQATQRQDLAKAQGEELQATQAAKLQEANATDKAYTQFKDVNAKDVQEFRQRLESTPLPAFVPTQDTVKDLAGVFSLIGILGTALSKGAGHNNAMGALASMTGMMKGWQEGRQDLYQREKTEFEKNFNLVKTQHEEFYKELLQAQKLAQNDLAAGTAMAHNAAVKFGSPIVAAKIKQLGLQAGIDSETEIMKATDAANKLVIGLAGKELDRQAKLAQSSAGSEVPEDTKQLVAEAALKGDFAPMQMFMGYSRNRPALMHQFLMKMKEIDPSLTGAKIAQVTAMFGGAKAAATTAGRIGGSTAQGGEEIKMLVPMIQEAAKAVDPGQYPDINSIEQAIAKHTGDPNIVLLNSYIQTAKNAYTLIMTRSGRTTDAARGRSDELISKNMPIGQLDAALAAMSAEADVALQASQKAQSLVSGGQSPAPGGDIGSQARIAFGSYDPDKYDYRINPETGKIQRKAKE